MIVFGVLALALTVGGLIVTNRAKSPPAAYLGITACGAGIALGLISGVIALFQWYSA